MKESNINKLYTYTSMTEVLASMLASPGWIRVKQGLTLKQEIEDRIYQQDNAATTADLIPLSTLIVPDNDDVKLDDKVRELQHRTENFMHFERYDNSHKKHEWSLVKIDDLVQDWDILYSDFLASKNREDFIAKHFLYNKDFLKKLDNRILKSKQNAVKSLLGKASYKEIILRPWQDEVVRDMLNSSKSNFLLSLAPRFGKTFTILEYTKRYTQKKNEGNIILVPASKNLSSNASFVADYNEGGYGIHGGFDIITDGSLFQDEDKLLERLKETIPENARLIMVTDEADVASHTEISQEKIKNILENFNVVKRIAMSGTGIYKAAKIFRGVSEDDILYKAINYSELSEYESAELVHRHFFNIRYNMESMVDDIKNNLDALGKDLSAKENKKLTEILNINQAFDTPNTFKQLSKYLANYISSEEMEMSIGLQKSDVVMVFLPSKNKRMLSSFVKIFAKENPDLETLIITGDETTNADAQQDTKDKIQKMKKLNNDRKLVIFSIGMASRSYSIPEIRRVIIMGDGLINAPWYQKSARCLTYDFSKKHTCPEQHADIIRISFEECSLASELFLVENETPDASEDTLIKMKRFLKRNTFIDVIHGDDYEDFDVGTLNYSEINAEEVLDIVMKYTDTTQYIMARLWEENLIIDESLAKKDNSGKTSVTKSVSLSVPNIKNGKIGDTSKQITAGKNGKLTSKDEKALKVYVNILRTLPYIARTFGLTYDELMERDWENFIAIPKDGFLENIKNQNFNATVKSIFRNAEDDDEKTLEKIQEYVALRGE